MHLDIICLGLGLGLDGHGLDGHELLLLVPELLLQLLEQSIILLDLSLIRISDRNFEETLLIQGLGPPSLHFSPLTCECYHFPFSRMAPWYFQSCLLCSVLLCLLSVLLSYFSDSEQKSMLIFSLRGSRVVLEFVHGGKKYVKVCCGYTGVVQ